MGSDRGETVVYIERRVADGRETRRTRRVFVNCREARSLEETHAAVSSISFSDAGIECTSPISAVEWPSNRAPSATFDEEKT